MQWNLKKLRKKGISLGQQTSEDVRSPPFVTFLYLQIIKSKRTETFHVIRRNKDEVYLPSCHGLSIVIQCTGIYNKNDME